MRRRLPPERFSTGNLSWTVLTPGVHAYQAFNLLAVGRPNAGPSYVIRFIGKTLYLFMSINDDQRYVRSAPWAQLRELCKFAEDFEADNFVWVNSQRVAATPAPVSAKQGMLF